MTIEIHDLGGGHGDARALLVIRRLTVRNDHVQPVDGAALEEAD